MTLTKYQKGESMEGWNDCPSDVMMLHSDSSSSSLNSSRSSSSRRKTRRVAMAFDGSGSSLSVKQDPNGLFTSITSLPLAPPPKNRSNPPISGPGLGKERDTKDVIELLNRTFELPLSLGKEEIADAKSKLIPQIENLSSSDITFVGNILDRVLLAQKSHDAVALTLVKTDIVKYMMSNDGVSVWCTPLKRIIAAL